MCGREETTDHIIFRCALAQFVWCACSDTQKWRRTPASVADWQENFLEGAQRGSRCFLFNNVLVSSPDVGIFRVISFMQRWAILEKGDGRPSDRAGGSTFEAANSVLAI
jgi:hypothetical protein